MPARRIPPTVLAATENTPLPLDQPAPQLAADPTPPTPAPTTQRGRRRGFKPDWPGDDWDGFDRFWRKDWT